MTRWPLLINSFIPEGVFGQKEFIPHTLYVSRVTEKSKATVALAACNAITGSRQWSHQQARGCIMATFGMLGWLWLAAGCQGPPPKSDEVLFRELLRELQQKAEAVKLEDRQRALDLFKKAEQAGKAHRWSEAEALARQAEQLEPDLPGLKPFQQQVVKQLQSGLVPKADWQLARMHLLEAVDHMQWLVQDRRFAEAQRWSETIRDLVQRFPKDYDMSTVVSRIEEVLGELRLQLNQPPPEPVPVASRRVPEPRRDKPLSWKQKLAMIISVDWQQATAKVALQTLADATGLTFTLDEARVPARLLEQPIISLQSQCTALRALEMILETLTLEFVPIDAEHLLITTKAQALARAVRPDSLNSKTSLRPSTKAKDVSTMTDKGPVHPVVGEKPKPPAYLVSPEAFRNYFDALLGPGERHPPPPKETVLPPPKADLPP